MSATARISAVVLAAVLSGVTPGQITQIPAMTVPSAQITFNGMPTGNTTVAAINASAPGAAIVDITRVGAQGSSGVYDVGTGLGRALGFSANGNGTLIILDPNQSFESILSYRFDLAGPSTQVGVSIGDFVNTQELRLYNGGTQLGTVLPTGAGGPQVMFYESATPFDRVELGHRINFVVPELWVEVITPPPTCTVTGPVGVVSNDATIDVDAQSPSAPTVDLAFEYSLDGGVTWNLCTPSVASPLASNPIAAVPTGPAQLVWDTMTDNVGVVSVAAGVLVQVTVDDLVSVQVGTCQTAPFDVDNTALCQGICGDCDLGGSGPDILDALVAAQIAALIVTPSLAQTGCCDVDSSGVIDIIDALVMAQAAALLPVTLICP